MTASEVYILILNYNSFDKTAACIESLERLSYPKYRIVILDNGSPDQSGAKLQQCFARHTVILNGANLGYAAGNNAGARWALAQGAQLLWILSPDTVVEPDTLTRMVEVHLSLKKPGLVGSLTLYDRSDRIYFYKGLISRDGRVRHLHERLPVGEIPEIRQSHMGESDYINGASILFSKEVAESAGLIPEDYFLYFEDPDWSLRVQAKGFENRVAYRAIVHHMKADNPKLSYVAEYYCRRNEYFFRRRNGFSVSRMHFLARLQVRLMKHQVKSLAGVNPKQNRNMAYVIGRVIQAVRDERMGFEALQLPYPGE